jgi:hypothetical protein
MGALKALKTLIFWVLDKIGISILYSLPERRLIERCFLPPPGPSPSSDVRSDAGAWLCATCAVDPRAYSRDE